MKRSPNSRRPSAGLFGGRFVLGITGGIASGKSTVLAMLAKARIPVCSADELSHQSLRKNHPAYNTVVRRFGKEILASNGEVDRRKLGKIVFESAAERRWLQKQIHPHVLKGVQKFIRLHKGFIAVDIPLLYEAGYQSMMDKIVVIYATRAQQIARLKTRNHLTASDIRSRIAAQWPLSKKKKLADIVLDNTRDQAFLRKQVKTLLGELLKKP